MHTQSESHVRTLLAVGEDPRRAIDDFSGQFVRDFVQQLRTAHGEKPIHINRFYQEYIADKMHLHMNATKWSSLTEFAKHLGREGICRVEETDKGLNIAYIDTSPEALRRQEALRRKEAQDKGDEEWEQRMLKEQIRRAQRDKEARGAGGLAQEEGEPAEDRGLQRQDDGKITLSFGAKPKQETSRSGSPALQAEDSSAKAEASAAADDGAKEGKNAQEEKPDGQEAAPKPVALKLGAKPQTKNVFAQAKKNAFASGGKKPAKIEQPKKMSEAERIMREEMERKRSRDSFSSGPNKKQRI